jgi:hypothetical protein
MITLFLLLLIVAIHKLAQSTTLDKTMSHTVILVPPVASSASYCTHERMYCHVL